MRRKSFYNVIRILTAALLVCCCLALCSCHTFAWYIPKQYGDEQMTEIYDYLKGVILSNLDYVIASVGYVNDGLSYNYTVFEEAGKVIINHDVYVVQEGYAVTRGLYYDGTSKLWDVASATETVTDGDVFNCEFLFERIRQTAEYFKTEVLDVMDYRDDSYCHECFPYGFGMAQMYYLPEIDEITVSASWTVEKRSNLKELPLIHDAEFYCGNGDDYVRIQAYGAPYGLDERIPNIMQGYEDDKQRDEQMLYKQVYVKGFDDVLTLELYNNDAAKALYDKLADGDVTVTIDDYGSFEKVGSLGFTLPTSDEQFAADYGDVMLYQGDKIVIFYGQNTWDYTPLGYIGGYSESAFREVSHTVLELCKPT